VLRELGYEAVLVVLKSDDCLAEVEDIVGAKCMIWCGSDWGVFGQSLPNFNGRKCCGFVDGRLTGEVMGLVNGMSIQQVVGTKRGRRGFEGWLANSQEVAHDEVGGITAQKACITGMRKTGEPWEGSDLPFVVGRDASTVLSVMEPARRFRQAPANSGIIPLQCRNLGSETHPVYHGGGLLPDVLDKSVQIVTPTLFAKPGFWGLRGLSSKEILLAKDLSEIDALKLATPAKTASFLRGLTPGRCLVFGFNAVFNGGGLTFARTKLLWESRSLSDLMRCWGKI
jgi:hypothetical protein